MRYLIKKKSTGEIVGRANTLKGAWRSRDRNDNRHGSYAHRIFDTVLNREL